MARASGSSHALAALVGLFAGEVLVTYAKPAYPRVISALELGASTLAQAIETWTGLGLSDRLFVPMAVAVVVAFVWGTAFHVVRYGPGSRY